MTNPSLFTWIGEFDPLTLAIQVCYLPEEDITDFGTEFDTFIDIAEAKRVYPDLPSPQTVDERWSRFVGSLYSLVDGKPAMLFETHEVYSLRFEDRAMPEPS